MALLAQMPATRSALSSAAPSPTCWSSLARQERCATWRWLAKFTLWCAVAVAGLASVGCGKAKQERAAMEALREGAVAIEQYSAATDRANSSHREVLAAFAAANASSNLTDYKAALRTKVLPAMDTFIAKLAAMPTGTSELKRVHGGLTEAYRRCRDAVAEFERELKDPAGLPRFDAIRTELQQAVRLYSDQLSKYYAAHRRQLRIEAGKDAQLAAQATATAAAATEARVPAMAPATAATPSL